MGMIRIAVVGAGLIGREHMRVIQDQSQLQLVAVVDPAPQARPVAEQARVPLLASLEELLQKKMADAVVLASPNALHVPQALQCIEAGLPVLLEKPMATTVEEARHLLEAVTRRGAKLLVGHHRAHSPIMARARDVVAGGSLGRLVAVMGSALFFKPEEYFAQGPWRTQPGGGPIQINLIHDVHNLRMLCGEVQAVQAMASHAVRGFAVEDTVAVGLRFESGVLGTFMLSDTAASARSWEQTSRENKAYPSYDDEDCYILTGTLGSLSLPSMRIKTYANTQQSSWMLPFEESRLTLERQDPLVLQMAHFVRIIQGHASPLVSAYDGLQNQRVVEAISRCAASQQGVSLA